MTPAERSELCDNFLYLGRTNDNVEGYSLLLEKVAGIAKRLTDLNIRVLGTTPKRVLVDNTRISVKVLSSDAPNAIDLRMVDSSVVTDNVLDISKLGKHSGLLAPLLTVLLLLSIVF